MGSRRSLARRSSWRNGIARRRDSWLRDNLPLRRPLRRSNPAISQRRLHDMRRPKQATRPGSSTTMPGIALAIQYLIMTMPKITTIDIHAAMEDAASFRIIINNRINAMMMTVNPVIHNEVIVVGIERLIHVAVPKTVIIVRLLPHSQNAGRGAAAHGDKQSQKSQH